MDLADKTMEFEARISYGCRSGLGRKGLVDGRTYHECNLMAYRASGANELKEFAWPAFGLPNFRLYSGRKPSDVNSQYEGLSCRALRGILRLLETTWIFIGALFCDGPVRQYLSVGNLE